MNEGWVWNLDSCLTVDFIPIKKYKKPHANDDNLNVIVSSIMRVLLLKVKFPLQQIKTLFFGLLF